MPKQRKFCHIEHEGDDGDFAFDSCRKCYKYKAKKRVRKIWIEPIIEGDKPIGWMARGKHPPEHFINAIQFCEDFQLGPDSFKMLCDNVCYQRRHGILIARYITVLAIGNQLERIIGAYNAWGLREIVERACAGAMFPWNRSNPLALFDPRIDNWPAQMAIPGNYIKKTNEECLIIKQPFLSDNVKKYLRIKVEIPKHIEIPSPVDSEPIKILWPGKAVLTIGNNTYKTAGETEEKYIFYIRKSDVDLLKKIYDGNGYSA